MLVPDVEGTGLPLTELLPYMKIKTKQIKKHHKINVKQKKSTHRQEEEEVEEEEERETRASK